MFRITKDFHFSASHQLFGLAADHPCARLHGHNYVVRVELSAPSLNDHGFVRDYRELDALKQYLDDVFDHRHLNDVPELKQTTAEAIAQYLYQWCHQRWPEVSAISVSETPKTWAEYRPKAVS